MPHSPILRVARPADAKACLAVYAPAIVGSTTSFEYEVPSEPEFARRIETTLATHPWIVAEDEAGTCSGYAYATSFRARPAYAWTTETSVYIAPDARRSGVARRLYEALFACLEEQGFAQAVAGIVVPNEASVAFHEALGFEPVGTFRAVGWKLGGWCDVGFWIRPLASSGAPARDGPRPFRGGAGVPRLAEHLR